MRTPETYSVAPHATMIDRATMSVTRHPKITSARVSGYSSTCRFFSTTADCR